MRLAKLFGAGLFAAVMLGGVVAEAAPKGLRGEDGENVGKKLFNFNVIVYPGEWAEDDAACGNSGHRIFFRDGPGGAVGQIYWNLNETENNSFQITDCDGTTDGDANVVVNQAQDILVYVRLVGPANTFVDVYCQELINEEGADICLIDDTRVHKGNSFTKIMQSLLDGENEEVLWTLDFSTGAKNLQVWVMENLGR